MFFIIEYVYDLLFFLICFTFVYTVNFITSKRKLKKNKNAKIEWVDYLIRKFSLDKKRLKIYQMIFTTSLINAFIIAFVATIITKLTINYVLRFMIAFVLVFALMYSLYEIYGRYLVRKIDKERRKNK